MPNFVGKKKKPRWNKYLKSSNFYKKRYLYHFTNYSSFLYKWTYKWENIPSKLKKSELPLVGTKGILKVWVKGSCEADCEERGGHLRDEGEWFWCLSESVWETECIVGKFEWGIWNSGQILSLIHSISMWLNLVHVENLST